MIQEFQNKKKETKRPDLLSDFQSFKNKKETLCKVFTIMSPWKELEANQVRS